MPAVAPTNLLPTDAPAAPAPTRSGGRRRVAARALRTARTVCIVIVVAFAVLSWTTRSSNPNIIRALGESATVRSVLSLLRSPSSVLEGEREDRITILLLGMGGAGHEGPLLTDTILIASIQPSTRAATLISVPRDLLVPASDGTSEKANAIHAYAEGARGDGAEAVRDALERAFDLRIPYYVRVDFRGFVGFIDAIGGVDVDVERTLDDPQYPITGMEDAPWAERFERLVIPAGRQRMDGALALKYVRSRHALGIEGSDFARARRQQRLLLAARDRAVSWGLLGNPRRLLALLEAWRGNVRTNLSPLEIYRLSSFASAATDADVARVVFADGPGEQLTASIRNGAYVLQPRDGTFEELRTIIRSAFRRKPSATAEPAPYSIEIWNGTTVTGLAHATAAELRRAGLTVTAIRNAPSRSVERSVIYRRQASGVNGQESDDRVTAIATRLAQQLHADTSTAFPSFASWTAEGKPDLLIVLGASSVVGEPSGSPPGPPSLSKGR